jgi:phosphoglycerate dehydrogenase-like enzyme
MATHTIFISSPLEPEFVERIRAVDPARLEVIYHPDLLPPTRYVADHKGGAFTRTAEQTQRWRDAIGRAEIMWDFPPHGADGASDISFAKRLKWVQTTSTGVGPLVKSLGAHVADVLVTTARGVHAGPLAEFVFMALLAHFRGLRHLDSEQQAHRWIRYCGAEIAGRTLVTIGAGDLARGVAKVGRALDMRIIAVARTPAKSRAHNDLFDAIHPTDALREVLGQADAVVVTVPHTPATEHLIDAAAFAAMPPGCAFVNIGRGQVVDEAAMIGALRSGRLAFAALDVAVEEPLPPESPLWDMPNVLISPHSASTVTTENAKITEIFCRNLRCWLDGRHAEMRNVLDKSLMY